MKNHLFTKLAIILTLALCSSNIWAGIAFTVGVTGTGSSSDYGGSNYNQMYLNTEFYQDDAWKGWLTYKMSKAGITFEGKDLYITYMNYNDANKTNQMQFQKYRDSDTEHYQVYSWSAYDGKKDGDYWNSYIHQTNNYLIQA